MAATARLTRALQQQLGDELSRELLTWMGQMDSSRSELTAFRHEFTQFVSQTNRRFDALDARFSEIEIGFEKKLANIGVKFDEKLAALGATFDKTLAERDARFDENLAARDEKFDARLAGLEDRLTALIARQYADLLKWSFVFWCGSVAAVTALVLAVVK